MKRILAVFLIVCFNYSAIARTCKPFFTSTQSYCATVSNALPYQISGDTLKFVKLDSFENFTADRKWKTNDYLIRSFASELDGVNSKDIIVSYSYVEENVTGIGRCRIFPISLSESLPENVPRKAYILYHINSKEGVLLFLDTLMRIKIRETDTARLIGGSFQYKGVGYFKVYKGRNYKRQRQLEEIFNSGDAHFCDGGIPTYNSRLDCKSYDPFMLRFKNIDLNKDGLKDFEFSGSVLTFCQGLEMGYGREDRKPLKREKISIVFVTHLKGDKLYWTLLKNGVCEKISLN